MKRCRLCHPPTMKPLSEFSLDTNRPDGHRSQCKECANKNTARYLSNHPGYAKTYDEKNKEEIARKYREQHPLKPKKTDDPNYQHNYYLAHSERIKAQAEKSRTENPGRVLELNSAREKRDRLKVNARKLVQHYIRKGKMQRLPCEVCGGPDSQAHHSDHAKPVEIGSCLSVNVGSRPKTVIQDLSERWIDAADRRESVAKKRSKASVVCSGASSGKKWPALSGWP